MSKQSQKILIPKGTINPQEDTLIEIPKYLKQQPVVVASRNASQKSLRATSSTGIIEPSRRDIEEFEYDQSASGRSRSRARSNEYNDATSFNSTPTSFHETGIDVAIIANLNATEQEEKMMMHQKLEAFQEARRQFLLGTTSVASKMSQTSPMASGASYQDGARSYTVYNSPFGRSHTHADSLALGRTHQGVGTSGSPSGRSRQVQMPFTDDDEGGEKSCSCSSKSYTTTF